MSSRVWFLWSRQEETADQERLDFCDAVIAQIQKEIGAHDKGAHDKATPRPWILEGPLVISGTRAAGYNIISRSIENKWNGGYVTNASEHDARLIVEAVNAYDSQRDTIEALVNALKTAEKEASVAPYEGRE